MSTASNILDELLAGNAAYVNGDVAAIDKTYDQKMSASPQHPKAVIVSCLDSRVPVERIFNQGVGDLFVARVAGNVMNDDIVGSLEFACIANEVKLVMVLGHTSCGAVKGACANVELGQLTQLLNKIKPAVESAKSFLPEGESTESDAFYNTVAAENAKLAAAQLCEVSPGIAELVAAGKVKVVSAICDLQTQEVSLVD